MSLRYYEVRIPVLVREVTAHVEHRTIVRGEPPVDAARTLVVRMTADAGATESDVARTLELAIEETFRTRELW